MNHAVIVWHTECFKDIIIVYLVRNKIHDVIPAANGYNTGLTKMVFQT